MIIGLSISIFHDHSIQQWPPPLSDLLKDLILASGVIWISAVTSFSRNFVAPPEVCLCTRLTKTLDQRCCNVAEIAF